MGTGEGTKPEPSNSPTAATNAEVITTEVSKETLDQQQPNEEAMDVDSAVDAGLKDIRREVEGAVEKGETAVEGPEVTPPTSTETASASDAPPPEVPVPAEAKFEAKVADTTPAAAETTDSATATTPVVVTDATEISDNPPDNGSTP